MTRQAPPLSSSSTTYTGRGRLPSAGIIAMHFQVSSDPPGLVPASTRQALERQTVTVDLSLSWNALVLHLPSDPTADMRGNGLHRTLCGARRRGRPLVLLGIARVCGACRAIQATPLLPFPEVAP